MSKESELAKAAAAEQASVNRRIAVENASEMLRRVLPEMTPDERLDVWYRDEAAKRLHGDFAVLNFQEVQGE